VAGTTPQCSHAVELTLNDESPFFLDGLALPGNTLDDGEVCEHDSEKWTAVAWYKFRGIDSNHRMTAMNARVAIYSASPDDCEGSMVNPWSGAYFGASDSCKLSDADLIVHTISSQWYYMYVYTIDSTFNYQITFENAGTNPPNDLCKDAIEINLDGSSVDGSLRNAASNDEFFQWAPGLWKDPYFQFSKLPAAGVWYYVDATSNEASSRRIVEAPGVSMFTFQGNSCDSLTLLDEHNGDAGGYLPSTTSDQWGRFYIYVYYGFYADHPTGIFTIRAV